MTELFRKVEIIFGGIYLNKRSDTLDNNKMTWQHKLCLFHGYNYNAIWYQKFTLTASFARRAITAFGRFRSSGFSAIGTKSEKKITFFPLMFTFSISKQFITNAHTVEPRCNKPLYNKVVSIMNNFVYPSNRKIYGN